MSVESSADRATARPFLSIAQIDARVCDEGTTVCDFGQPLPARCDLVVWDLADTVQQVARDVEGAAAARVLPPTASNRLAHRTREAQHAIDAALQRGALVVVLVSEQPGFVLHTLEEPVALSLLEVLPGAPAVLAPLSEEATDLVDAGAPFAAFFDATRHGFHPAWSLQGGAGMPVAHMGPACVARFDRSHPGGVLWLPALKPGAGAQGRRALIDALSRLTVSLRHEDAPVLLAHDSQVPAPQALQDSRQAQADIENEWQRLQERREAAAARGRQLELAWSLCAGEPTWALSNFAQACAAQGWQQERITVGKGAVVLSRPGMAVTLIAIGGCADLAQDAQQAVAHAERVHAQAEDELAVMAAPCVLVYLADNHLPLSDRPGVPAALQAACDRRQHTLLTSDALYRTWAQGSLATLVATLTRHPSQPTRTTP